MQRQEPEIQLDQQGLTITYKLVFLVEAVFHPELDQALQEKYLYAVTGAFLADLILLKKVTIKQSSIEIFEIEKTDNKFINSFFYILATQGRRKTLLDSFELLKPLAKDMIEEIKRELLDAGFLVEKREGLPLIGPKVTYPKNKELMNNIQAEIKRNLGTEKEMDKEVSYLILLLEALNLLVRICESKRALDNARIRAEELLETDPIAKLLCRDVANKIKLEDLKYMAGGKVRTRLMR